MAAPDDPIRVSNRFEIPGSELEWRFDTAGTPGGQHANRSATRVELSWDAGGSRAISEEMRSRILARLGSRAPAGRVTVTAAESRSQWRNRMAARRRLARLLQDASVPEATRVPTLPSRSARERRLRWKRHRGRVKRLRRRPDIDD